MSENDQDNPPFLDPHPDNVVQGPFAQGPTNGVRTDRVLASAYGQLNSVIILGIRKDTGKFYVGTRVDRRADFFDILARAYAWAIKGFRD